MAIEVISKIKQKNNGNFKLMDASDVETAGGQSIEQALNTEIQNRQNADNTLQSNINAEAQNRQSEDASLRQLISSVSSGSPKGVYANAAAIKSANPETGVYITSDNGHIYSWTKNSSGNPIDLGVYQAAEDSETVNRLSQSITEISENVNNLLDSVYYVSDSATAKTVFFPMNIKEGNTYTIYTNININCSTKNVGTNSAPTIQNIGNVKVGTTIFVATEDAKYFRIYSDSVGTVRVIESESTVGELNKEVKEVLEKANKAVQEIDTIKPDTDMLKQAVGDVKLFEFYLSPAQTGTKEYWNEVFDKTIDAGTSIKLRFLGYTGQNLKYIRLDLKKTDGTFVVTKTVTNPNIGDEINYKATEKYTAARIQIGRTASEWDVHSSFYFETDSSGIIKDISNIRNTVDKINVPKVYHVEKDGSGDFTSLVEAINEATKYMDSVVYLGKGTWNIIEELGTDYVESVSSSKRGVYLKNRIHLICSSRSVITCKYTGTRELTREWLSAFNSGLYGFTIENATIESDNVRYAFHDERDSDNEPYKNHYINCTFKHHNGKYPQVIGGGLGRDGHIIVDGCYFEGDQTLLVYWHNSGDGYWTQEESQNAKSFIEVKNCYFANNGTFKVQDFGKSQMVTKAYVSGNSFGSEPYHDSASTYSPYTNTELVAWNNEIRD